ncbi:MULTISPECIES: hypothetical protein [Streptomyces]|uniref:hypothetical protein n=1 Tax=Streptomyces TaxID=1883 RepID=UPI0004CD799E|nr:MULTISPECIES: hypothetical protein [Streptomyces]KOT48402.1 hypothetical protein ADK43_38120 [Streptomyces rimosus subsp. rimosus]
MTVRISLVVVLLIIVLFLVKKDGLKTWHALVVTLFGFLLTDTQLAGPIQSVVSTVAHALSQWRL